MVPLALAALATAAVGALAGFGYVKSGIYDVGASKPHTNFTEWVTHETMIHSVRSHAKGIVAPASATADQVLREVVRPVVDQALVSGAAEDWFFIRYGDPHWHLRLRFHGEPARLHAAVLPALQRAAAAGLEDGRLWRLQLDTYEREVERYGGGRGVEALERGAAHEGHHDGGTASIHEMEAGIRLDPRPPVDAEARALLVERILPGELTLDRYASGEYQPLVSWARASAEPRVRRRGGGLEVTLALDAGGRRLEKVLRLERTGAVEAGYRWDPALAREGDRFTTELSVFGTLTPVATPEAEWWRHPVETVAKSERGLDRTRQGKSITLRWPVSVGAAGVRLPA